MIKMVFLQAEVFFFLLLYALSMTHFLAPELPAQHGAETPRSALLSAMSGVGSSCCLRALLSPPCKNSMQDRKSGVERGSLLRVIFKQIKRKQ